MSRALFAFRDPDAEPMEVVELDGDRLEAVRGTSPTSRMHFFEFGELSIDIELTVSGEFCEVVGVVADPGGSDGTSVTLDTVSASFTTAPTRRAGSTSAGSRWAWSASPSSAVRAPRWRRPGSTPAEAPPPTR